MKTSAARSSVFANYFSNPESSKISSGFRSPRAAQRGNFRVYYVITTLG